ncbi:hypothetical protein IKG54_01285 [Candidatus Saccharibacteria bacterium]|nr:hypothetical protein [Candidatus Saccharibacteria bacterium]
MSKRYKRRRNRLKWAKKCDSKKSDWHHLLYQGRHWDKGYAKLLRAHPYLKVYIPQYTLHRKIHSKIHDIPCPNEEELKDAYVEMLCRLRCGQLDIGRDTMQHRLDFLIEMWNEKCPATVAVLKWQRDLAWKYQRKTNELVGVNAAIMSKHGGGPIVPERG